jgi:hypothetical protein
VSSLAEHLEAEACPHLAVFLNSPEELPGVLVNFYALGARRGGWLAHRALPGEGDRERAMLTEAGLDVATLEAEGRMVVVEMDFDAQAEGSAEPWREALDAALARAARASRTPAPRSGPRPSTGCSRSSANGTGCLATAPS